MLTRSVSVTDRDGRTLGLELRELYVDEVYSQDKMTLLEWVERCVVGCGDGCSREEIGPALRKLPMSELRRLQNEILALTNGTEAGRKN